MNRKEILSTLETKPPAVLIVGAGINGAGTFRDLALNCVDVVLVDRGDFCSGASAASSHMAHGGIRYLENGEFRLVREAVRERNRMLQNAPHLVKPLATTIPIFKVFSGLLNAPLKFLGWLDKPSERGALVIKLGLLLYDAYTGRQKTVPRHSFFGRREALGRFPQLNPAIRYAARYYDGSIFSPERYTVELILDAEGEGSHARALNYVSLAGRDAGKVVLKDEISGQSYKISPQLIVNAAGPWIDHANRGLALTTEYIGGTKGSHLVIDNPDLRQAIGETEFFFENQDGRIVLIFPLADKVMIGTTDMPIGDPDSALCTEDEVDYFIEMVARVFPDIPVTRAQIVFRFSGVRPLAKTQAKNAGQITRDHHIMQDLLGDIPVYSLVGGKWTSYRVFAEQVTDRVLADLGRARKAETACLPIGGGRGYATARQTGSPRDEGLFARYGTRSVEINAYIASNEDAPLEHMPELTRGEIAFLVEAEKVVHLDDLLLRRTMLAFLGHLTRPLVDEVAGICAAVLGWDESQRAAEVTRVLDLLAARHAVRL
ncbi:MAG: glycerol-3-phosphate dehydrogenase/oxidase [Chloroflexota bacterium]